MFDGFGIGLEFGCAVHLATGGKLDHTAGVGTGDLFRAYRVDVAHFRREDFFGHFVFNDVVYAGGAAADVAGGHFDEVEAGDGFEELSGGGFDFLAVAEVTGILVGDAAVDRAHVCVEVD